VEVQVLSSASPPEVRLRIRGAMTTSAGSRPV
jgi:hypothetical protein